MSNNCTTVVKSNNPNPGPYGQHLFKSSYTTNKGTGGVAPGTVSAKDPVEPAAVEPEYKKPRVKKRASKKEE